MKKNVDRFVHAVFCDDIRREVGNKMSLMGCYQSDLIVQSLPMVLPKLCVFVTVSSPLSRPLKKLAIRVDQGEKPLVVMQIAGEDLIRVTPPPQASATRFLANAGIELSPFAITAPGEIRVVVVTEDGEMMGPRLRIQSKTASETSAAAPAQPQSPKATRKKTAAMRDAPVKMTEIRRGSVKKLK